MKNVIKPNFWKNKKVFVTGHTGFKGSWLCLFLKHLGAEVTGYSLKPNTKPNLFDLAGVKKIIKKSIIADVRNYQKINNEIKKSKATILFHLAAQPLVRYSYLKPKDTFDTNFTGSLNILESIKNNKIIKTGIIITTDKVYDNTNNKIFKETDRLGGLDPYSSSKVCVEFLFNSYLKSFFKKGNQMIATVRAGNVIGGGDYSLDRLVPDIYKSIKSKKKIFLRNPQSVRPWQHVLEPLSGYILLSAKLRDDPKKFSGSWNFGPSSSEVRTVKEVASKIIHHLGKGKIEITGARDQHHEAMLLQLNCDKSHQILNWEPRWHVEETLKYTAEWYKKVLDGESAEDITKLQVHKYFN